MKRRWRKPATFDHLAAYANTAGPSGTKEIDWKTNVVVLSGPIPRLQVNIAGNIVRAINVTINGGQNAVGSPAAVGGVISVDNISTTIRARSSSPPDTIKGSGSTWRNSATRSIACRS